MRRAISIAFLALGLFVAGSALIARDAEPTAEPIVRPVELVSSPNNGPISYVSEPIDAEGEIVGATWDSGNDVAVEVRALSADGWSD